MGYGRFTRRAANYCAGQASPFGEASGVSGRPAEVMGEEKIDQMDREKSAKTENTVQSPSKENPLYKIAEEVVDEALSQIPRADYPAYTALRDLAKHFADSDPEKAQRFVAEAVVHVRNFDQPQRTMELARMGALAAQLGNKEGGK
jgi:hypothetical protein